MSGVMQIFLFAMALHAVTACETEQAYKDPLHGKRSVELFSMNHEPNTTPTDMDDITTTVKTVTLMRASLDPSRLIYIYI